MVAALGEIRSGCAGPTSPVVGSGAVVTAEAGWGGGPTTPVAVSWVAAVAGVTGSGLVSTAPPVGADVAAGQGVAAIIVAGGGATRLGGFPKATLTGPDGRSLLRCAVDACGPARLVVVVGRDVVAALGGVTGTSPEAAPPTMRGDGAPPAPRLGSLAALSTSTEGNSVPSTALLTTCEEPAGSGPARAVAAGLARLAESGRPPGRVLVLAGDLPTAGPAVRALLAAPAWSGRQPPADGAVAVAGGRRQWLLGLYRFEALARALALPPWRSGQRGEALRDVLSGLDLAEVEVDPSAATDLDTWADVVQAGFTAHVGGQPQESRGSATRCPRAAGVSGGREENKQEPPDLLVRSTAAAVGQRRASQISAVGSPQEHRGGSRATTCEPDQRGRVSPLWSAVPASLTTHRWRKEWSWTNSTWSTGG